MNLNQMKKIDLSKNDELEFFISELKKHENFIFGPAGTSLALFECFTTNNESFSLQLWLSYCYEFGIYFSKNVNSDTFKIAGLVRINSEIKLVETLVDELKNEIKTIEYMKSMRKWVKLVFPSLPNHIKVVIYAIDYVLCSKLKDKIECISFTNFINEETKKVQIAVKAYLAFVSNELNEKYVL